MNARALFLALVLASAVPRFVKAEDRQPVSLPVTAPPAADAIVPQAAPAAASPAAAPATTPTPASTRSQRRVLVLDFELTGVHGSDMNQLPDLVEKRVTRRGLYTVVSDAEMHAALTAQMYSHPCVSADACAIELGHAVHADFVVAGAVKPSATRFSVSLALMPVAGGDTRRITLDAERWHIAATVSRNVDELFDDLQHSLLPAPTEAVQAAPAAAPAPRAAKRVRRVLVLPFDAVGVGPEVVAALPGLVDAELAGYPGLSAASSDDLHHLSETERVKDLAGCRQDESCLIEIARKMEADLVVAGSAGQVGNALVLTLTLGDPRGGISAQRATESVNRVEDLPAAVPRCVRRIFGATQEVPRFHLPDGKKLAFAVFDLKPTGISQQTAQNLTQVLSTEVKGVEGASVISRADITAMLQLGEVRQQLGCDDDACMTSVAGALGVDRLITGDAGRLGALYIINLRLINVRTGVVENRVTETFEGDEEQLLRAVRKAARDLLGIIASQRGRLTVTASQNGARVLVDDEPHGATPLMLPDLLPRRHSVRVTASGCFDWRGDVYIDPIETTSVWALLRPRPLTWYQQWWVWTAAGAVVAGTVTAAVIATHPPSTAGGTAYLPAATSAAR
jgi:TolB-like protein